MSEDNLLEILQNNGDLKNVISNSEDDNAAFCTTPKIKMSRWLPPLMGESTYGIRCEACWGFIMRNAEGAFVKTPFCPHCGKKMNNPD